MKRLVLLVAILVAWSAVPVTAVGDNGTGAFWLTSGANGTGEARNFNVGPDHLENIDSLRYNSNCSGTCDLMNNNVSSIIFSCGVSGSAIDQGDWVRFHDLSGGAGTYVTVNPDYPASCVNGVIKVNLSVYSFDNRAGSITTNE